MESSEEEVIVTPEPEAKPKRKLTPAQLEQLAKAREKANVVRKRNAQAKQQQKQKEQQIQDMQRQALLLSACQGLCCRTCLPSARAAHHHHEHQSPMPTGVTHEVPKVQSVDRSLQYITIMS